MICMFDDYDVDDGVDVVVMMLMMDEAKKCARDKPANKPNCL